MSRTSGFLSEVLEALGFCEQAVMFIGMELIYSQLSLLIKRVINYLGEVWILYYRSQRELAPVP